jgi:hypothetical protein
MQFVLDPRINQFLFALQLKSLALMKGIENECQKTN